MADEDFPQDASELLDEYLKNASPREFPRKECCNSSRSLYCPYCCQVLVPREDWPSDVSEGNFKLPFDVDIILGVKERRTCATGVHIKALSSALESASALEDENDANDDPNYLLSEKLESTKLTNSASSKHISGSVRIFSLMDDNIPSYDESMSHEKVFVLFPDQSSVPISSVGKIDRLVVPDIKWSRQHKDAQLTCLPRVKLDSPPAKSHFWRWHNAGDGCLSTIEAIYFAAMDVTKNSWSSSERRKLINIMWLFSLQHAVINKRSLEEQRAVPFSEEGKGQARLLRQQHPGWKIKTKVKAGQQSSESKR